MLSKRGEIQSKNMLMRREEYKRFVVLLIVCLSLEWSNIEAFAPSPKSLQSTMRRRRHDRLDISTREKSFFQRFHTQSITSVQQQQEQTTRRTSRLLMMQPLTLDSSSLLDSSSFFISMMDPSNIATTDSSSSLNVWIQHITELAQGGGPPIMAILIACLDSVPFFPTASIAIAMGAIFGFYKGLFTITAGQLGATALAFSIGRYILRNNTNNANNKKEKNTKWNKILSELTSGLNSQDFGTIFTTIVLARQSPILPFSVGNYFIGTATTAGILPILAGTIVGCLPLNILYVGAGAGGSVVFEKLKQGGILAQGVEALGIVVTLGFLLVVAQTIYKVWKQQEEEEENVQVQLLSSDNKTDIDNNNKDVLLELMPANNINDKNNNTEASLLS